MRSCCRLIVFVLLAASAMLAQSYRGVYVGQRDDLLPPEYNKVKEGEYEAQYGNERVQAFVNGALVTGVRVIPLYPLTLAEAVAKFGSIPNVPRMLLILDVDGAQQGVTDPLRRISYITPSLSPFSAISYVGFYDTNQAMLLWLGDTDTLNLQVLQAAAQQVSLRDVESRPKVANAAAGAQYLVNQAVVNARAFGQQAWALVEKYGKTCTDTPECRDQRSKELAEIKAASDKFRAALNHAEEVFQGNAELLNGKRPPDLDRLESLWKDFVPKVRDYLAQGPK